MTNYDERFSLATHFYVRLRRHLNRGIDAVWMAQNDEYAREVIRLAREHGHPELEILADRFAAFLPGTAAKEKPAPARTISNGIDRVMADHYVGALR